MCDIRQCLPYFSNINFLGNKDANQLHISVQILYEDMIRVSETS